MSVEGTHIETKLMILLQFSFSLEHAMLLRPGLFSTSSFDIPEEEIVLYKLSYC